MLQEKIDIVAVNTFVSVLVIDYKLKYKFNSSCCFTEEKSKLLINYPSSFFAKVCQKHFFGNRAVAATDDDDGVDPTQFDWIRVLNNSTNNRTRTTIITEQ